MFVVTRRVHRGWDYRGAYWLSLLEVNRVTNEQYRKRAGIRVKFGLYQAVLKKIMNSLFGFALLSSCVLPHIFALGFDAGSSCNPKASRRGRAQLIATIPCDLTEQSYCNLPGTLYPWHAVRRFVHENQGLMKRMYGDEKHISVLRNEIDSNEIELDDVEQAAKRYSRSGWKKNKYLYSDIQNAKSNDVLTEPYFRPTTSSSTTTTKTPSTTSRNPTQAMSYDTNNATNILSTDRPATSGLQDTNATVQKIATTINAVFEKITLPSLLSSKESVVRPSALPRNKSESTPATISTTLRIFLPANKVSAAAITPPQDDDRTDPNFASTESVNAIARDPDEDDSDSIRSELGESAIAFQEAEGPLTQDIPVANETSAKQANRPSAVFPAEPLQSQLFQDAVHKEPAPVVPPPNARGVNACPVKEEVVAPFWANNTRGEVLALLNLYPFEQYVHWEKCTNELKQMWCREGCRCEQQFRLHRLLAYDPHNECRGIFSDWFRFPSCCICKCYDIPLEYRVTSRSPRSMAPADADAAAAGAQRHPADVAQDQVRKAVYEHASESWYHRSLETMDDDSLRLAQPSDDLELDYFD